MRTRPFEATLGFWSAAALAALTAVAFGLAVTTMPISGPSCLANCVTYPFLDVAAYVPHDYNWMLVAVWIAPLFVVVVACVHGIAGAGAGAGARVSSLIALCFAIMAAAIIGADYWIQIETMQPSILAGETEGLALASQYNPHGIFIALEDLGYLLSAVAFVFLAHAFGGPGKLDRSLRWLLLLSGALTIGARLVLGWSFGFGLEYRFEVTAIAIVWCTLIVAGVLLAFWFRRKAGEQ